MKTQILPTATLAFVALLLSGPAAAGISDQDVYPQPPVDNGNPDFNGPGPKPDIIIRPGGPFVDTGQEADQPSDRLPVDNTTSNIPVTPPSGYGTPIAENNADGEPQPGHSSNLGAGKKTVSRSYENDNGSLVEAHKRVTIDEQGNVRSARQFEISDADGNPVATGRDRDWKNVDGSQGSSQAAVRSDAEGNRILKRRQEHENADGDVRSRNGKTVTNADGERVATGVNGEASMDGTTYKSQTRSRRNADGDVASKTRRGKLDADGNKKVVKQPNQAPPNAGSGARDSFRRKRR